MKILILNGSPRMNGNTSYAMKTLAEGIAKNTEHEVEILNVTRAKIGGCVDCGGCQKNGGDCIMKDDTKAVIEKIYASDAVVFASPVYWWGISSQLKAVLDKFHSRTEMFKKQNKKLGIFAVGEDEITGKQYELINTQFDCVCEYLGWEKVFGYFYSANLPGELSKSEEAAKELSEAWKLF